MQVDFSANFFELFDLPLQFDIDETALEQRYRQWQRLTHPDNFASASEAEKRWSVQAAAHFNTAHTTLSKPLDRAVYLLKLQSVDLDVETDTQMAPDFLMTQMELREALEEIESASDPYAAADKMRKQLDEHTQAVQTAFKDNLDKADLDSARGKAREWQFLEKLMREVDDTEARLDDDL